MNSDNDNEEYVNDITDESQADDEENDETYNAENKNNGDDENKNNVDDDLNYEYDSNEDDKGATFQTRTRTTL